MSIRKRLILSNIAMIAIPVITLFAVEMIVGFIFYIHLQGNMEGLDANLFMQIRFICMAAVLVVTNGGLAYYVSKSILVPIAELSWAAGKISEGDLQYSVKTARKDELGELSNTFDTMRVRLQEAEKAQQAYEENRRELVARISHDLKTPLTSIKGYIKGIQDGVANTPEKMEHYLSTVEQTATRMDGMIDELLLYSKLDLQEEKLQLEKVDLRAFFLDFIEETSFFLAKKGGQATLTAAENETFVVEADREKLRRVVLNLVDNSMKYMAEKSKKLQVTLAVKDDQVVVEMSDNGSGISAADLPFIFDSFYRTDASRNSSTGGSGLGLSIVKKIIQAHGGSVWARSRLNEGTAIYFTLKKVTV